MTAVRGALGLLFVLAAPSSGFELADGREAVVQIDLSHGDKMIAVSADKNRKRLEACGYRVLRLRDLSLEAIRRRLGEPVLPAGTVVLVDSHGGMKDETFVLGKNPPAPEWAKSRSSSEESLFSGKALLEALESAIPRPAVWLDTCYAGACPIPVGLCVGTACGSWETSLDGNAATATIIELMCSRKGDCRRWKQVDGNGDGVIDGVELSEALSPRRTRFVVARRYVAAEDSAARRSFERLCSEKKGAVVESKQGYEFFVSRQENGEKEATGTPVRSEVISTVTPRSGPEVEGDGPKALFAGADEVERWMRSYAPDQYRRLFENKPNGKMALLQGALLSELTCQAPFPAVHSEAQNRTQYPDVRRFSLSAPACGGAAVKPASVKPSH